MRHPGDGDLNIFPCLGTRKLRRVALPDQQIAEVPLGGRDGYRESVVAEFALGTLQRSKTTWNRRIIADGADAELPD